MVQDTAEASRTVDTLIFDARGSRLANELGRRPDHVTELLNKDPIWTCQPLCATIGDCPDSA